MTNVSDSPFTKRSNELIIILILGFIFILAASTHNLFESVVGFVENHSREGLGLLLVLSIYTSFGMGIFSIRRWIELENTLILYREAEDDLKERNKMYRALFEQSNDAVIISDGKKILDINKKGCEIFGFGQRYPLNNSLMSFIPAEYLPELQRALKESFKQETSNFEMRYQRSEGEIVDIEVTLTFIGRTDNIVQIVAKDITNIRNAERWGQENQERLKAILDNTLCGILLIEASSRKIVIANPVALKTTGYSEMEIRGMVCNQLICQPGEEGCISLSPDQAEDLSESILFKATGEPLPILRSVVPVSIRGTGYFVESFIDLSERKKAEEDLLQAKLAAEEATGKMAGPDDWHEAGNPGESIFPVIFEPEGSDGSEPLVMVVEDDKLSSELLIFTLKEAGYRVTQAITGKQALFLAQKLKPFVITLDLMLPGMNGWDVLKSLKKDHETAGIPVLVFSIDDEKGCNMLWGAFDHLVKPVEKSALFLTLDRLKEKTTKESPKILIADRQETIVELMTPLFNEKGCVISRANGGKEIIERASTELPDAIILDLMMPEVSGFEVIRVLKKNPETVDIPIVVCTANKDLSAQEVKILSDTVSFVVQKEDLNKETFLQLIRTLEPEEEDCKECIFSFPQAGPPPPSNFL